MNNCKYCPNCGSRLSYDESRCPYCGQPSYNSNNESSALGICAIVFAFLESFVGLILAIIGLCTYKNYENRRKCKIAIGIVIAKIVLSIILVIVAFVIFGVALSEIDWYDAMMLVSRI